MHGEKEGAHDRAARLFPIFAPGGARGEPEKKARSGGKGAAKPPPPPSASGSRTHVESAPVQRAVRGTGGAAHPFFAKRAGNSEMRRVRDEHVPMQASIAAPWPHRDAVHVAPETRTRRTPLALPPGWARRTRKERTPLSGTYVPRTSAYAPPPSAGRADEAVSCEAALSLENTIPAPRSPLAYIATDLQYDGTYPAAVAALYDQLQHAAPQSLSDARPSHGAAQWIDRWRPTCAAHVLGNEQAATYMRDWLHELRVSFTSHTRKRPIQTRVTQRKRGRPRMYDDEAEFHSDEDAWFDQFRAPGTRRTPPPPLTNCLLLEGPCGSGKSAAVHACAAELGFAVFELYAGVGRRSGKELASAVGQLSRNHMVAGEAAENAPRQSLILLDEVDLLMDDDAGFWPAVVELVRDSHRPVILTCNDASLVPIAELPLQNTLQFAAPPLQVGATYLQLVALAEGYIVSQAAMQNLYASTCASPPSIGGSGALHPGSHLFPVERALGDRPSYDLRAALMQLQYICLYTNARALRERPPAPPPEARAAERPARRVRGPAALQLLDSLRSMADAASACDLLDTHVAEASSDDTLPVWARARLAPQPATRCTQPAEAPITPYAAPFAQVLGTLAAADWLQHARAWVTPDPQAPPPEHNLPRAYPRLDGERLAHCRLLGQFLQLVHIPTSEALPRASLVVDYAPHVRQIMLLDQLKQAAWAAQLQTSDGVRATRNSARLLLDTWGMRGQEHGQWIPFGPADRAAGHQTGFTHS